jgi:uncharacterized protein
MEAKEYALITGASSGLGKYLSWECARKGYSLILVSLPGTELQEVADLIAQKAGIEVHIIETDLSLKNGPDAVFEYCTKNNLRVRVLINNAGMGLESSFTSLPVAFCSSLLQLNMLAVVELTQLFLPGLLRWNSSYILNVSSLASYSPMPFKGIYAASKSFINSFSRSLRTELKNTGVSVSVLCPGPIPTNDLVRKRISRHGWFARAGVIEPEQVAVIAIRDFFNRKAIIIPGLMNRFSRVLMYVIPSRVQQEILYRSYIRKEEGSLTRLDKAS